MVLRLGRLAEIANRLVAHEKAGFSYHHKYCKHCLFLQFKYIDCMQVLAKIFCLDIVIHRDEIQGAEGFVTAPATCG